MSSNTTFGFPVPRKPALSSCWVLFSAVERLDLFGVGGGGHSRVLKQEASCWGIRGHAPPEDFEI